jgi:transglutaminase-like putative cysteine protease
LDCDHPLVVETALKLTAGCGEDVEKAEKIYYFIRDFPYDIYSSFQYLAEGKRAASDVLAAGHAFCMGKASVFVSLCRVVNIPARIGFQQIHCPNKEFMSDEVRELWRDRSLPWHSLGEAYLNGRWIKLDATIPVDMAAQQGKYYAREFDGVNDIPTVEGPVVKEIGSFADYPEDVARWYERMAKETIAAVNSSTVKQRASADESFWSGPTPGQVKQQNG